MLFGLISLNEVTLKPGQGNALINRIFSFLYLAAYCCVIGFSIAYLELFDDKSAANIPLIFLNVLSLILAMGSAWRLFRNKDDKGVRFILRNFCSSAALLNTFLLLGVEDDASVKLDRTWVNVVVTLVAVAHGLQVFVNKVSPDEPDCKEGEVTLGRKLFLDLILAGSVTFLALHLGNEDNKSGLLFERGDEKSHVLISGLLLISVHLLLEVVTRILELVPGLQDAVIRLLTCGGSLGDEKMGLIEHCENKQEILPLNRIPLYRHLVASSALACLSYSWGRAIGSTGYVYLLISVLLYLAADVIGRGNNRVIG
jgi:hypothetical protein